jgi:hypothetical protein
VLLSVLERPGLAGPGRLRCSRAEAAAHGKMGAMAKRTVRKVIAETETKTCTECKHWKELKNTTRVAQVLREVIQKNGNKLASAEVSLAEFLKLVQLEREFEEEPAKEIDVTWTDPSEESEK